jgi:ABC-type dipeptide/oligopeptide/nickel transport system permease component
LTIGVLVLLIVICVLVAVGVAGGIAVLRGYDFWDGVVTLFLILGVSMFVWLVVWLIVVLWNKPI